MLIQHLLARCRRGAFDTNAGTNGFKTAAMSENASVFQNSGQMSAVRELLETRGSLPDSLALPGAAVSGAFNARGLLRISHSGEVTVVSRSFRVADLCDNRGTVTFSHSYLLTDRERDAFLEHPVCAVQRERFDTYENVNRRAGGLSSGNAVPLDEGLSLFGETPPPVSNDIFTYCGFDESSFIALISAICDGVAREGKIALMSEKITAEDWDREGGSSLGEMLLSALYTLLPTSITKKLGGVSYWNDMPDYGGLQGIHLLIVPDGQREGLCRDTISLIDLKRHLIRNVRDHQIFGRFLWRNRDNGAGLSEFYQFQTRLFGSRTELIRKSSDIMDLTVKLYSFEKTGRKQDTLLEDTLTAFGEHLPSFPEAERFCARLLEEERRDPSHSASLEKIAVQSYSAESESGSGLSEGLLSLLFQNLKDGQLSGEGIELLQRVLRSGSQDALDEVSRYLAGLRPPVHIDQNSSAAFLTLICEKGCFERLSEEARTDLVDLLWETFDFYDGLHDRAACERIGSLILWRLEETISAREANQLHFILFRLYLTGEPEEENPFSPLLKAESTRISRWYPERGNEYQNSLFDMLEWHAGLLPGDICEQMLYVLPLVRDPEQQERWVSLFSKVDNRTRSDGADNYDEQLAQCIGAGNGREFFLLYQARLRKKDPNIPPGSILNILETTPGVSMEDQASLLRLAAESASAASKYEEFLEQLSRSKFFFLYWFDCLNRDGSAEDLKRYLFNWT